MRDHYTPALLKDDESQVIPTTMFSGYIWNVLSFRCSEVRSKDVQMHVQWLHLKMVSGYIRRCSDVQWLHVNMFSGYIWRCSDVHWIHLKMFSGYIWSGYIKRCSDVQWLHQKILRCSVFTSKAVQWLHQKMFRCSVHVKMFKCSWLHLKCLHKRCSDVQWLHVKMFSGYIWRCSDVHWIHLKMFSGYIWSGYIKRCSDVQWLHQKILRCSVFTSKAVQWLHQKMFRCSVHVKMFKCSWLHLKWLHKRCSDWCSVVNFWWYLAVQWLATTWRCSDGKLYLKIIVVWQFSMQVASTNNTVECLNLAYNRLLT